MWEFAAIVFLMELFPTSLLAPSLFGFFENLAGILAGSWVGSYIDRHERLMSIRTSVVGQNAVIAVASAAFGLALRRESVSEIGRAHV